MCGTGEPNFFIMQCFTFTLSHSYVDTTSDATIIPVLEDVSDVQTAQGMCVHVRLVPRVPTVNCGGGEDGLDILSVCVELEKQNVFIEQYFTLSHS